MRSAIAFVVFASGLYIAAERASNQPQSLTLVGARLYADPDAPAMDDAVVVVANGVITAAAPRTEVKIPAGTTTVDCKGLTITSGFYNSHTSPTRNAGTMPSPRPATA